jgi:DNA-binding SARP family transcriptional activator/WD40 repeat protein
VEFRILGPLEVVQNGEPLVLGAVQQRALLAVLVLHRGVTVSVDRLIDQLWGERAPATGAKTIQVYVSQLRKVLGAGVIVTERRGYRLEVEPEQVDVDRFDSLVAEGRRALSAGDATLATKLLSSALGLWRGEPLTDFAYERFAQGAIARMQQARLAALEDRIEADLALGSNGELIGELESLVASNPLQERLRGQLMLSLYRCGRQADALSVYRQTRELLREELGLEPSRGLQELERSILEQDASLDGVPGGTATNGARLLGVCPFKGLAFFDRADADYFFGRERLVSDLMARLVESTLVGILGPSGIGKSSLLRAGVLPALSGGVLPGSCGWRQLLIRPGEHPCAELRRALGGDPPGRSLERLSPGERIVVAVDQFEELFTVCQLEAERAAFLEELVAMARDAEQRALVLVALRADFYGRVASYPSFGELLTGSHLLVGPMDRGELARAIEQPAARAGLELEHGLADALVSDVAGEPGGLPLLSTTLLELWREREGRALRYGAYRASGGVHGAVARLAEAAYAQLGETERRIARGVMLRLAGGEDGTLARRRVPLREMERVDGAGPVVAALTDARLLTVSDGEVELSHEALLREWPRYRAWLEEDRIGRRLHTHLTAAAVDWDTRDRDPGDLYRGARLASALDWAAQHDDQLNALERGFVQASRVEAERAASRQRAQNRRLRSLLLGVGVLLVFAVIAGIVALVQRRSATHEAGEATAAARVALARELGAQAVNEPRLDLAMLLAREAVSLDRSPQTEGTLLATLQRRPTVIGTFQLPIARSQQLALSPDGRTLAVSAFRANAVGHVDNGVSVGDVRFYDVRTHALQRPPLTDFGGARAPVYSNDGSLLAYPVVQDSTLIAVRDARTLRLISKLAFNPFQTARQRPDIAHAGIVIAPDQHTVYCEYRAFDLAGNPGPTYLYRWSLPSGRVLSTRRIDLGAVLTLSLIDGGARLVLLDARHVNVFDAHSLRRLSSIPIAPALRAPSAAAFSPDGRTVAIGSRSGAVTFVEEATGESRPGGGAPGIPVTNVAYSPDGHTVVSAGNDDRLIVWDPRSATSTAVLSAPAGRVQGVAFSRDGHTLYSSLLGGVLLAWDLTGDRSFGRRFALGAGSPCCRAVSPIAPPLALSPDGKTFAVRLGTSTIGLFSAQTLQQRASFTITPGSTLVTALAWSPTAPELVVGGYSGLVQLWGVDGAPRLLRSFTGLGPLIGRAEAIQAVAFSPDGRLVAATDSNETEQQPLGGFPANPSDRFAVLAIWRTSSAKLVAKRGLETSPARFDALAFSRSGRLIAVSLPDAGVLVLDPTTGQVRRKLHPLGADGTVSLAFAPDGTLATGTLGGIVQTWNPISGTQLAGPVPVAAGPVTSIAFDPTGHRLATTGGQDGTVKLWFTSTLQQEGTALSIDQGAAATAAFEPGGTRLLVVNDRGNGFSWPISLAAWQQRACTVAGRNLTHREWARFVTGHTYTRVCP